MSVDFKKLGTSLAKAGLPLLAKAIVPGGDVILSAISSSLGTNPEKPDEIPAKLSDDPAAVDALRRFERENQTHLLELALAAQQADVADRASARQREMAVRDWTPRILAAAITLGFFATLAALLCNTGIPAEAREPLLLLMGTLQAGFMACLNYYFGSSSSSNRKTDLLAAQKPPAS